MRGSALLLAVGLALSACGGAKEELVVKTGGATLDAKRIDADPLALLPSGAVGVVSLDARRMFASSFGKEFLALVASRVPLPPAAGFQPERDLQHLYLGAYTYTGLDTVGIAVGSFDQEKIESAADGTQLAPLGLPVVRSSYAGRTLYTAGNLGFAVLTAQTVLLGNETGIRRALDRLQEGRLARSTPGWLHRLMQTDAPMVAGFALKESDVTDSLRQQLPFLGGAETARILGNFEPPGINLAGSITYPSAERATAGAAELERSYANLGSITALTQFLGFGNPIKSFEVRAQTREAQFVAGLDGAGVTQLLGLLAQLSGMQGLPTRVKASESAPVGSPR